MNINERFRLWLILLKILSRTNFTPIKTPLISLISGRKYFTILVLIFIPTMDDDTQTDT
jgi:hypothetical protein